MVSRGPAAPSRCDVQVRFTAREENGYLAPSQLNVVGVVVSLLTLQFAARSGDVMYLLISAQLNLVKCAQF